MKNFFVFLGWFFAILLVSVLTFFLINVKHSEPYYQESTYDEFEYYSWAEHESITFWIKDTSETITFGRDRGVAIFGSAVGMDAVVCEQMLWIDTGGFLGQPAWDLYYTKTYDDCPFDYTGD